MYSEFEISLITKFVQDWFPKVFEESLRHEQSLLHEQSPRHEQALKALKIAIDHQFRLSVGGHTTMESISYIARNMIGVFNDDQIATVVRVYQQASQSYEKDSGITYFYSETEADIRIYEALSNEVYTEPFWGSGKLLKNSELVPPNATLLFTPRSAAHDRPRR
jgi:hypothetical protein